MQRKERTLNFGKTVNSEQYPQTLAHRIDLFKDSAQAYQGSHELFRVDSWLQVMLGQGITPKHYHDSVSMMSENNLHKFLSSIKAPIHERNGIYAKS